MKITRKSEVSGITRTMDLDITVAEVMQWEGGKPAQYAFPNLTADQREFIMTGTTADEWDAMCTELEARENES